MRGCGCGGEDVWGEVGRFKGKWCNPKINSMKLSAEQIHDIAGELICGMKVYINRDKPEYVTILDWDGMYGDTEFWEEEMERIQKEWSHFVVLEKLESWESFNIMKYFIDEVDDEKMQQVLINTLNRRSPFANFKAQVESSDFREQWFNFRQLKYEEHVRQQLEFEDIEFE